MPFFSLFREKAPRQCSVTHPASPRDKRGQTQVPYYDTYNNLCGLCSVRETSFSFEMYMHIQSFSPT